MPMPQAIVDPAELRRFAQNLKKFNGELHHGMSVLHGQLVDHGGSRRPPIVRLARRATTSLEQSRPRSLRRSHASQGGSHAQAMGAAGPAATGYYRRDKGLAARAAAAR